MNPRYDLDLEDSKQFLFRMALWLIMLHTIAKLVTKCSVVQKIPSGQTFTDILNHCDLDLERSNPILPQDTLAYNAVLPN